MHKWVHTAQTLSVRVVCRHSFNPLCPSPDAVLSRPADCGEEKEDGTFTGAEELFGTTSESDTSTFHGFEDDELEEPATNSNGIPNRRR